MDEGNRWRQLFNASALPSWDPVWEETHQDFNTHEYKLFRTTVGGVLGDGRVFWTDHWVGCAERAALTTATAVTYRLSLLVRMLCGLTTSTMRFTSTAAN